MSERLIELRYDQKESQRLDKYLVSCLPEFSRSRLQGLIKDGFVTVNDSIASKSGLLLEEQALICVHIPPVQPSTLVPEHIPLDVIYEDADLLVVNKPAGMVVHPSAGHESGTLVHAALAYAPEMGGISGEVRPGVVHRLDKNTSGLILLAKNDQTQRWLQDQFRARKVEKVYLALVDGHPPSPNGRIEAAIGRDTSQRKQMAVVASNKGREAITEYFTVETFPQHALLELHPITGRTHQIRLHMGFIGCPVAGDTIYGHRKSTIPIKRHFLHAASLKIHLSGESQPRKFQAPLPGELERVLEQLRRQSQQ